MFKFERMIAWQKGVEFGDRAFEIADRLPQRLQFSFGEQLRRAALNVTNNLAEGSGRRSPGSRRSFYDIAKGSVYEVISILAILRRREQMAQADYDGLYQAGDELASIISGLVEATLREETTAGHSPRIREESGDYTLTESDYPIL